MRKNKIYASISADVVDSTSLSVKDLKLLHSAIKKVFSQLDSMVAPVWGRVVRGDTIESVADKTEYVLAGTL